VNEGDCLKAQTAAARMSNKQPQRPHSLEATLDYNSPHYRNHYVVNLEKKKTQNSEVDEHLALLNQKKENTIHEI
jgi:hypothetical protein